MQNDITTIALDIFSQILYSAKPINSSYVDRPFINERLLYTHFKNKYSTDDIQIALKHIMQCPIFAKCYYADKTVGFYPSVYEQF